MIGKLANVDNWAERGSQKRVGANESADYWSRVLYIPG